MKHKSANMLIIPCLILGTALCGCTTQSVNEAKEIYETYTYADKYEYETDSDGVVETKSYQEEKPTFDETESVHGETMAPIKYKPGSIKNIKMNEEYKHGGYVCSVTDAVITKDMNYAYEVMNTDSADQVCEEIKKICDKNGYIIGTNANFLWVKVHVKYEDSKEITVGFDTLLLYKDKNSDEFKRSGFLDFVQDQKEEGFAYKVVLNGNSERDYYLVLDMYNYNPDISDYYLMGNFGTVTSEKTIIKYSGELIKLDITDKTNR